MTPTEIKALAKSKELLDRFRYSAKKSDSVIRFALPNEDDIIVLLGAMTHK